MSTQYWVLAGYFIAASLAQSVVTGQLSLQAMKDLGMDCQLNGPVSMEITNATANDAGSQITLTIQAKGLWVYSFSQTRLKQLATLIAGKSQADARTLLLKQAGIADVEISASGSLPSADRIQWQVQAKVVKYHRF